MSPLIAAGYLVTFMVAAYAFLAGGKPERIGAVIVLAWQLVDPLYHAVLTPATFARVDFGHVLIDGGEFIALIWLALQANRVWPCFAAATQTVAMLGHLAVAFGNGGEMRAYWAMTELPLVLQLLVLTLGVAFHAHRLRRLGAPYRNWRLPYVPPHRRRGMKTRDGHSFIHHAR